MPSVKDNSLAFETVHPIDKIISDFGGNTLSHSLAVGGFGFGTDTVTIANPTGKKAFITLTWSIDGVNFYPSKYIIYVSDTPQAAVGACVDASNITFFFSNFTGSTQTFTVNYVLTLIE